MSRWKGWFVLVVSLVLAGCDSRSYREVEVGYRGPARLDPWLAAKRFAESYDRRTETIASWRQPGDEESVWFVPAHSINNASFSGQMEHWMRRGGHLVVMVDHPDPDDDWSPSINTREIEPACTDLLAEHGMTISADGTTGVTTRDVQFRGQKYEIETDSRWLVSAGGAPDALATAAVGYGRLTVLADARPFRNRWIDQKDHAALLKALFDAAPAEGVIVFARGFTLSLWSLLMERAWAALLGLALVIVVWLWKNLPRFGPMEAVEEPSPLRGYDHHLEALGDFQWRLDHGAAMLAPIREEIIERSQRALARWGRLDADIFTVLGERAGISRERVHRALVEPAPRDAGVFTRTAADLQSLLKVLI